MQHRDITQYKLFILTLRRIGSNRVIDAAAFFEHADLVSFYNQQIADTPFHGKVFDDAGEEQTVTRYFKKGSFLEDYQPVPQIRGKKLITYQIEPVLPDQKEGVFERWIDFLPSRENLGIPLEPDIVRNANMGSQEDELIAY